MAATVGRVFVTIPFDEIAEFRRGLLGYFAENEQMMYKEIEKTGELSDEVKAEIVRAANEYLKQWNAEHAVPETDE